MVEEPSVGFTLRVLKNRILQNPLLQTDPNAAIENEFSAATDEIEIKKPIRQR